MYGKGAVHLTAISFSFGRYFVRRTHHLCQQRPQVLYDLISLGLKGQELEVLGRHSTIDQSSGQ